MAGEGYRLRLRKCNDFSVKDFLAGTAWVGKTQPIRDLGLLRKEQNVYWVFKGQTFRNEQPYADYQHFRVSIKIGP